MKYDFSRCNNLRWELGDDKGFCRVFEDAAGDSRISFIHSSVLCIGLPEDTFRKSFELNGLDTIRDSDKEFLSAVKFIPRTPETYTDWQVGDVVEIDEFDEINLQVVVAARINNVVICNYIKENMVFGMFTCEELKKKGSLVLTDYEKELAGKSNCEFNEGDVVLVRDSSSEKWRAGLFVGMEQDAPYPYVIKNGGNFKQCIPYNENTWRLLGTTDEYKEESDE